MQKGQRMTKVQKLRLSNTVKQMYKDDPTYAKRISKSVRVSMSKPKIRKKIKIGVARFYASLGDGAKERNRQKTLKAFEDNPGYKQQIANTLVEGYASGRIIHPCADPNVKKKIGKKISVSLKDTIKKNGHWMNEIWDRPGYRERVGNAIREAQLRHYAEQEYAEYHRKAMRKKKTRDNLSKSAIKYWDT